MKIELKKDEDCCWVVGGKIHIVSRVEEVENEAGCDAEVWHTKCGQGIESWYYSNYGGAHLRGTLEEALESGADICDKCFSV